MICYSNTRGRDGLAPWTAEATPLDITCLDTEGERPLARILTTETGHHPQLAVLITHEEREIRINGAVPLTVNVLRDKDEIRAGERVYLFAAHQGGTYDAVADGSRAWTCAGCSRPIVAGERTARCPACPAEFHAEAPPQPDGSRIGPSCRDYEPICKSCRRSWASMSWGPESIFDA